MLEGRVGSTLVMQLLATSLAVALDRVYPYENSYLTYFVRLVGQMVQPSSPSYKLVDVLYGGEARLGPLPFETRSIQRDALGRDALAGLWEGFSRTVGAASAHPVSHYAEKYWGSLNPVVEAGLEPVVIDLVRDPRDVVASIRAFNAKRGYQLFGRAQAADDSVHLRRLIAGMSLRFGEMNGPGTVPTLTLRYEDLVTAPADAAGKIATLVGVPLDPAQVPEVKEATARHVTSPSAAASIGRWRHDLSDDEVASIERKLGPHMAALGYELKNGSLF
jgi:hypothetical protein